MNYSSLTAVALSHLAMLKNETSMQFDAFDVALPQQTQLTHNPRNNRRTKPKRKR